MLQGVGEVFDGGVGIAVLDAFTHTVPEMPLKNHQADLMERTVGGADLGEDVLSGDILSDHLLYAVELPDDPVDADLERVGVTHAVSHRLLSSKRN